MRVFKTEVPVRLMIDGTNLADTQHAVEVVYQQMKRDDDMMYLYYSS